MKAKRITGRSPARHWKPKRSTGASLGVSGGTGAKRSIGPLMERRNGDSASDDGRSGVFGPRPISSTTEEFKKRIAAILGDSTDSASDGAERRRTQWRPLVRTPKDRGYYPPSR